MTTAAPFPHVVIRASAGTGKTFQLSNRFLGLVAAGQLPEQILATTFARKAAGEILDRVLLRLADAGVDAAKLADFNELRERCGPALDQRQCVGLLRSLIDRLHRLQISTLDSFFLQIAGSFSLELGLPLGWRIVDELEDEQIRAEAIQQMLEDHPLGDSAQLVRLLGQGAATRSITSEIGEVVKDLYEVYRQTEANPDVWRQLPRRKELEPSQLRDALTQLAGTPLDGKSLNNARAGDLEKAERGDWDDFIERGLARPLLAGEEKYNRQLIPPEIAAAYRSLLDHARAVLVNRLGSQNEGTHRLLEHFDAAYQPLKRARRAMRFDDVTRELGAAFGGGRLDDVGYRLDARVAHLLLDEFQDTSLPQWEVIGQFARQVTAAESAGSLFCVGDVKQAIFGWRGGIAELIGTLGDKFSNLVPQDLTKSYRSSQVVIDTVNRVFSDLPANGALGPYPTVTAAWAGQFTPHSTARAELPGCCRLLTAPKAEGRSNSAAQQTATLEYAAQVVAAAAKQNPGRSIGVLVRRNQAIARLVHALRSHKDENGDDDPIFASGEGGNPLTDSPAVQLILSLLAVADHPGDTVARFHVAHSPLGPTVGFSPGDDGPGSWKDDAAAWRLAADIRGGLLADGYGPTIHGWVRSLAPDCGPRDLSRLEQLVELAYGFDDGAIRRPDEFAAQVRQRKVEDPLAAPVRVMTIHKAKGLEFDIVVLPQLDESLIGRPPKLVEGRDTPTGPIQRVCRYAGESIQSLLPEKFQTMFAQRIERVASESLCLLYVAMTRAVHQLDIIVAPQKRDREESAGAGRTWPRTFAGVLLSALFEGDEAPPSAELYRHGDPNWSEKAASAGQRDVVESLQPEEVRVELKHSTGPRRRGLERRSPSKLEGGSKVNLQLRLHLDPANALSRGTLIHKWLEQIRWLEDGAPDEETLRRVAGPLAEPNIVQRELQAFRPLLARPAVAAALSRAAYADPAALRFPPQVASELTAGLANGTIQLDLQRERLFAVRLDDAIVQGSIDRLLLFTRGGKPVAADLLDFKTDGVAEPAEVRQRVEVYRPQLEEYRRAVAAFTGLKPERISARLLFVEPGIIESLDVPA